MKEESAKYNERVSRNINKIMNDQSFQNDNIEKGSAFKRNKSADVNSSSQKNPDRKEPTYIQKLLGLNRTDSSTSNKYPFSIPPWQKLLKSK